MKNHLRTDFYIILTSIFLFVPMIIYFNVRPLTSALFFFIIPTTYLLFRSKKPLKRVLSGALLIGSGFGLIFNILASANNVWNEVGNQLVFNYRIFGFLPADEPVWFFFWALFIIVFYEHFYDREKTGNLSGKFKYVALPTFIVTIMVVVLAKIDKSLLLINYAYFFLIAPAIFPVIFFIRKHPPMLLKFIKTGAFFFMNFLVYELTAMKLGQWYFPGQYIGWVDIFGLKFPIEEFLLWMGLSPFAVLAIYEGCVDDEK